MQNANGIASNESTERVPDDGKSVDLSALLCDPCNLAIDLLDDPFTAQVDTVVSKSALRQGCGQNDELVFLGGR